MQPLHDKNAAQLCDMRCSLGMLKMGLSAGLAFAPWQTGNWAQAELQLAVV